MHVTGCSIPLSLCLQVLRVHVTTTRVKYLRPEPESGNRVIRHFSSKEAVNRCTLLRGGSSALMILENFGLAEESNLILLHCMLQAV
jgi:hypothetical protein